ncbi:hypothetical protein DBZ45_02615 [Arthrobacter globiformis]|uniref:Uncharacterized protein n=1 Tax=Arthrobacter globiformis TaxID=1665 RepID=A0A328HL29_ARTGO|nr:hypothetical protein DBZ45_02615 [Arthrobacter globiformis]
MGTRFADVDWVIFDASANVWVRVPLFRAKQFVFWPQAGKISLTNPIALLKYGDGVALLCEMFGSHGT